MPSARPWLLAAAAVTACTKPAPPSAPEAPAPSAGRLAVAQSRPVEHSLPALERSCEGEHLDLRWVGSDAGDCWNDLATGDWPQGVETKLVPSSLTLEAGGVGYVDYGVFNGSSETVTVAMPSLGCFADLAIAIYDEAGEKVPKGCGGGGGCSGPTARISLPPGGDARHRLQVRALSSTPNWTDDGCTVEPAPLPPGTYVLRPTQRFADEPPEVRLKVTASTGTLCTDAASCINAPAVIRDGPSDPEVVRQTYGRACALGEGFGCRLMGDLQTGEDAERSYVRAAALFGLGCDAGQPGDCYQLGFLHEEGTGVPKDGAVARAAHRRAYDQYLQRCDDFSDFKACEMAERIAKESILANDALVKEAHEHAENRREFLCRVGACPED